MQWNDLSYEVQMKVLDRIGDLIFEEKNEEMQFAIAAAIVELEVWSNTPCKVIEEDGTAYNSGWPQPVQASDPWEDE